MKTLGSLFAGVGGFDLGFERAGFKTAWQCEIDKAAQGVLRLRFPEAALHSDVREVGAHNLGPVDVLTFGSPCFPAGVLVLTKRGLLPIEEVVVGDEVVSHLGRWQSVVRVGSKIAPTLCLSGEGHSGLVTTAEHPFWSVARFASGTLGDLEWTPAHAMQGRMWAQLEALPEDATAAYAAVCRPMRGSLSQEGYRMGLVHSCKATGVEERVYNIEVEGDHSYTADGIIVHNCQDLSVAGKRAGLAGNRSGLFHEAARIIRELRAKYGKPDFAIWENVPGAFSSNDGKDFAAVVQTMVDLGARDVCWRVLDSQYFGVAQRRKRVFLVADFVGERAEQVLFEPESLRGDIAKSGKARKGAARSLEDRTGGGRKWPADVACTLNTMYGEKISLENQHALNGASLFVPIWRGSDQANAEVLVDRAGTLNRNDGQRGGIIAVPASNESELMFIDRAAFNQGVNAQYDPRIECATVSSTLVSEGPHAVAFASTQGGRSMPVTRECPTLEAGTGNKVPSVMIPAVAFAQNTRDEVRLVNGDGQLVGALAAQPGMKQTSYVAVAIGNIREAPIAKTITASMGSGPGETENAAFILEHADLRAEDSLTLAIRGRDDGATLEYRQDGLANTLLSPSGGRAGMGVGAVLQPIPFDTTQITSPYNYSQPAAGDPCHPLAAGAHAPAIAFHPTQDPISSTDVSHAVSNGSKSGTASVAVCVIGDRTHALTSEGHDASEDGTGRGTPITTYSKAVVRRLVPVETEILQGFPAGWTSEGIDAKGVRKSQADGPRYKQMGNAVTVNVAEWIAKRIAAVLEVSVTSA